MGLDVSCAVGLGSGVRVGTFGSSAGIVDAFGLSPGLNGGTTGGVGVSVGVTGAAVGAVALEVGAVITGGALA